MFQNISSQPYRVLIKRQSKCSASETRSKSHLFYQQLQIWKSIIPRQLVLCLPAELQGGNMPKKKKDVMVSTRPKGWAITVEGNQQATRVTRTQEEAITIGRDIARNNHSELRIQGMNGKIRETRSYGNDPCPPYDKK